MRDVLIHGVFDELSVAYLRFLEQASGRGPVHVMLLSDAAAELATGHSPRFPYDEREYCMQAVRYVTSVLRCDDPANETVAESHLKTNADGPSVPLPGACPDHPKSDRPKVIVTGCFDLMHSGHVRFFEEVSALGDLYVVVGHDANIRLLKGEGRPLFSQNERAYLVQSIRFVKQAIVSTGAGWLDAEPEIDRLKPDIYVVNEDGDRKEKREFCLQKGIRYEVLHRAPKPGLTARSSTALRGQGR